MGIASTLISAYEAGQDRRRQLIERERADQKEAALTKAYSGLKFSQPKGGDPQSGGVAGAYPPQAPAATSGGLVATPQQEAESAAMAARFPNAPMYANDAPVRQAPVAPRQSLMEMNADPLSVIMRYQPDVYNAITTRFKNLDDAALARSKDSNEYMKNALFHISEITDENLRTKTWSEYVSRAEQAGMDIPTQFEKYSTSAMSQLAATVGITEALLKKFRPEYVNMVPGTVPQDKNPLSGQDPFGGSAQQTAFEGASAELRQNPSMAAEFDAAYGQGAAARVLGGAAPSSAAPSSADAEAFIMSFPPEARPAIRARVQRGDLDNPPAGNPVRR
jgi:hypothetical protein